MDKMHVFKRVQKLLVALLIVTMLFSPVLSARASVKGLTLNKTSAMLKQGETLQLKTSTTGSSVTWSTDNKKIATVKNGLVTAKSVGTVNIKVSSGKASSICKVTVYQPAKKIKLVSSASIIEVGDTFTVNASIIPADATYQSLTWSVENNWDTVVKKVSKNKFKAIQSGTATIVAYQKETNKKYTLEVNVQNPLGAFHMESNSSKVTSLSTYPGGHLVLKGVMDDTEDEWIEKETTFTYLVKDTSIATVDDRGQITALKTGSTNVIVTAPNGKYQSCTLTVTNELRAFQMETLYADKLYQHLGSANYGGWDLFGGTDDTYVMNLPNDQIGVFCLVYANKSLRLELYLYNKNLTYISKKTIALPYTRWGGLYQGEDGNYYVAVGQENEEENDSKIVFSIIKMDGNFKEIGRCDITGKESNTTVPYIVGCARMTMDGTTLIVHTDRERYTSDDGLNHQSNITFMIDSTTMTQSYVGTLFPYNHVSHSFNQYVKMDGGNLIYVDHGDAYPRSVVLQTHYNFSVNGWSDNYKDRPLTNALDLINIKGSTGDNETGTKVNGFELGTYNNLVAGVSIPHDTMTDTAISSYKVQNVYVSLVAKDGNSKKLIWLTDYKEGAKISANNLRMVKITDNEFALLYQIQEDETYRTGLLLIDSNGTVLKKKEYDSFYSCYVKPLYHNGTILWIDNPKYSKDSYSINEATSDTEQIQFTRIYLD